MEGSSSKEERNQLMTLDVKAKVFNLLSNFLLVSLLVIRLLDINVFMSSVYKMVAYTLLGLHTDRHIVGFRAEDVASTCETMVRPSIQKGLRFIDLIYKS
jgi:hypothetical protein